MPVDLNKTSAVAKRLDETGPALAALQTPSEVAKRVEEAAMVGPLTRKGEEDDPADIVTKALGDLAKTIDERFTEAKGDLSRFDARLTAIETRTNRPAGDGKREPDEERKAFGVYLRHGSAAPADTLKALTVSSDPQGGYLAPAEMSTEFIRELTEFSPVRPIASVRTTGSPSVTYPKRTGITNALWRGETQPATGSEPAFGQEEITIKEIATYVDISNQLLADSAGQAEAEVRLALAEDFGKKEAAAFVNGDGLLQPMGFMSNANVGIVNNGHATVLSADALVSLVYSLPAAYRLNGTFAMNGTTLATVRKLKDGAGNYLWQPSYQLGQPETILGRPVVEMIDMPDIAADAYPIAFGDFSAYRIIDRESLSILVNPYLLATNGLTRIHATRRVGGGLLQATRIKKLKMAVS